MSSEQKVVIVTGASQGLGAGIVKAYREAGYAVVANSRNIMQSADTGIVAVPGDIGERAVAQTLVDTAIERFGRIDTLINNAGVFIGKPFVDYTTDELANVLNVNIEGFFHITQLALPHLEKHRGAAYRSDHHDACSSGSLRRAVGSRPADKGRP
ncbi:NAD(P)-dependent dehydrogenase (short-subunit alcohol dehydrogenase family) [Rhizobium sp. OAE497]